MNRWRWLVLSAVLILAGGLGVALAQKKPPETFTDPEKAGPDFTVQGEYEGQVNGKEKLGAQVVARGEGKFQVVLLPGGLPGADSPGKTRILAEGKTADGKTTFEGKGWSGSIADGKLGGKGPEGAEFRLARVERKSPTLGAKPPEGAVVLFDGSNADEWNGGKVEGGLLKAGATTKKSFKDFKLHVEFILPFKPTATGQSRGNSGVYLQGRYEVQILDSFGLEGKNNECGAIYERFAPAVNVCLPPLQWQTYDIDFKMARFDGGKKTADARVTVLHNGVKVHDDVAVPGPTGYGRPEDDKPGPINLQDHGNPVFFRNVWLVPAE